MISDLRRDLHATGSHFRSLVTQLSKSIQRQEKRPYLDREIGPRCVYIAAAEYSAGSPVPKVLEWLDRAVSYQFKVYEQWNSHFDSNDSPLRIAHVLAAASFFGRTKVVANAASGVTADIPDPPGVEALRSVVLAAFSRTPLPRVSASAMADLKRLAKQEPELIQLYDLHVALSGASDEKFNAQLKRYLREVWTGVAREYLDYLKRPKSRNFYAGQWCMLAAGMCKLRGFVPELDSKLMAYIPLELLKKSSGKRS